LYVSKIHNTIGAILKEREVKASKTKKDTSEKRTGEEEIRRVVASDSLII
jgi:carbamate kinase